MSYQTLEVPESRGHQNLISLDVLFPKENHSQQKNYKFVHLRLI
jgi:hypothetical protein